MNNKCGKIAAENFSYKKNNILLFVFYGHKDLEQMPLNLRGIQYNSGKASNAHLL